MPPLTDDSKASVMEGVTAAVSGGPALALETCARHLALLGATVRRRGPDGEPTGEVVTSGGKGAQVAVGISWYGPGQWPPTAVGSEACVQAQSGLMELHGRDGTKPRRLGADVASVAAGILATQGVLAGELARRRGVAMSTMHTSVLEGALVLTTPYLAMATTSCWKRPGPSTSAGPPFPTLDGDWIEIEALDPEAWRGFWGRLGVAGPLLGRAWSSFLYRFETATCSLPPELHAATAKCTLAELATAAQASDVTICRLRNPAEVLASRRIPPWHINAISAPMSAPMSTSNGPLSHGNGDGPLAGLRVVEATRRLQGPMAGRLLQMLGAEIVRVEPLGGDLTRGLPPLAGDRGAVFVALNRDKQAVELDLKQAAGRAVLLELIRSADVFLHNWRPGRAAKLALDAEDCEHVNPALVYAHASGWGGVRGRPEVGTDFLVQADTAMGHVLAPADEPPFPSRFAIVDLIGALVAAEGVLAGLVLRESTRRGCRVESSLLGAALALEADVLDGLASQREQHRQGARPVWGPLDYPMETAEGLLTVTVGEPEVFDRLCQVCRPDQATEECVAQRLREQPAHHWEKALLAAGIPAAVVCEDLADLARDPRLGGILAPFDGCLVPAAPWRWNR